MNKHKGASPYNFRGMARRTLGDLDGAIADFSEVVRRNPQFVSAYVNRGELLFMRGKYRDALLDFQEATRLKSNSRANLARLAIAQHKLGQAREAQNGWRSLIEQDERYRDINWVGKELEWDAPLIAAGSELIKSLGNAS